MSEKRYFLTLSYSGKNYYGWQSQPSGNTVQDVLNKALSVILKEEIIATGAGRTDTGVHAKYFIAHFDTISLINDKKKFLYNLNGILPVDIAVYKIVEVDSDKHARFSAISRTYKYFVSKQKDPFKLHSHHFIYGKLDLDKMNKATNLLFNYKDFTSFSKLHTDVKTNICKIINAEWQEKEDELIFTITADRFLRNMVRSIVGTLIDVGFGKISVDDFKIIIEKKDRGEAGTSSPAKGLFLWDIEYPFEV